MQRLLMKLLLFDIAPLILISNQPLFLNLANGLINAALLALMSLDGAKDLLSKTGIHSMKPGFEIEHKTPTMARYQYWKSKRIASPLLDISNGPNLRPCRSMGLCLPLLPLRPPPLLLPLWLSQRYQKYSSLVLDLVLIHWRL